MKSIIKPLALALILFGTVMLASPASATHPYTSTYCSGQVYNPLNGDELVERCSTYTTDGSCSDTRYFYKVSGRNVYYQTSYYCNGESWTCYANIVYVDTSPVRVGACNGLTFDADTN